MDSNQRPRGSLSGENGSSGRGVDRRDFLRAAAGGALALGLTPLLDACGAPASSGSSSRASATGRVVMPTYVPFQGPPPDLPATPEGVWAGYLSWPKSPVRTVAQAPGK